jgi:hypothetical protein
MHCGDTLLIPAPGTAAETPHLWIILTEPDPLCAIVCLSTLRHDKDQTVLLRSEEHPFINRDTTVLYAYAEIVDADNLRQQVADGQAVRRAACTPGMLKLIQDGVQASPFTPRKVQTFCRQRK